MRRLRAQSRTPSGRERRPSQAPSPRGGGEEGFPGQHPQAPQDRACPSGGAVASPTRLVGRDPRAGPGARGCSRRFHPR